MTVLELAKSHNWNMPTKCPICESDLALTENDDGEITDLYCTNVHCTSRYIGRINKWTNTLGMKGFGETQIGKLIESNIFHDIPDLYRMDLNKLANLEGFGEKSASKLQKEIDTHKDITLAQFIAGFNIPNIGEKVIQKVIDNTKINSYEGLMSVKSADEFCGEGVKIKTASKLFEGLKSLEVEMNDTLSYVNIISDEPKVTGGKLEGMSFCFTGALNSMKRPEAEALVEANGGTAKSGVSKGLSYLVTNTPDSGSSKNKKAAELGTQIITEEQFLALLG